MEIIYDMLADSDITGVPSAKLGLPQFNAKYLAINTVPTNIIFKL